jgi:hypothetical protein
VHAVGQARVQLMARERLVAHEQQLKSMRQCVDGGDDELVDVVAPLHRHRR